ncbi:MBL fold metallo-hydrolase [Phocaeicola sp.]|uniref:MBL fold metallo-hydrolase n=1 Tax=Phocaeicola sp. TaxID=2773926 RepID=UPI0023BF0099|nr:MBL fold metallo-hydrolase [Phocaeicola sp.]MDE5678646.1 MBL fold metallo-hydrolase [Phocaeicola sp.]
MKYTFKTFSCGAGDCIFFVIKDEDHTISIMVDCGQYKPEIGDFIENELGGKIDYLIATHIDNDHIDGLVTMLRQNKEISIKHILYNCYQRITGNFCDWSEQMKENVKNIYCELPVVVDMINQNINEKKAVTLAECILENESWAKVWQREYITDESSPIILDHNMGKIVFLSPSNDALDKLDVKYRKLFWQNLYKQKIEDFKKEETIYEALMRIAELNEMEETEEYISSKEINRTTLKRYAEEPLLKMSENNVASIAFVWEYQNHKVLFMGDADPSQVATAIRKNYPNEEKPILFDLIKVSHHGSAHSTSKELIKVADSEMYFFTGGSGKAPSLQTLGRIITTDLPDDVQYREIRYNKPNKLLKKLVELSDEEKDMLNFKIKKSENSYEVSC